MPTPNKTCKGCSVIKPLAEFHRTGVNSAGNVEYRGKCRVCVNERLRSTYDRNKVNMRSTQYIEMPNETRQKTYRDAILRMRHFGIMSEEAAEKCLARVDSAEY